MSEPKLDWSQAEVREAQLTVALEGDAPRGWKETFGRTAVLLGRGEWDTVKLKKQTVRVGGVTPGTEDKLRHFLEAVVQQANADHLPDETESGEDEDNAEEASEEESGGGEDAEMTERFRSFGDAEPSQE